MNKDVIYIEPEDDITDIITKIEKSKEKIVALVPPKKAGVFRSVVNIKLIAKAGTTAEKTIVLVTTDPSIIKLAAATKLPVTKNLQSAPSIPTMEDVADEAAKTDIVEVSGEVADNGDNKGESDGANTDNDNADKSEDETDKDKAEDKDEEEKTDDDEKKSKKKEDKKTADKKSGGLIGWIKGHKKLAIFGGIGITVLILGLVWAFVIAPAVDITVWIQTKTESFSENVSFTTELDKENAAEGKFYLEEKKIENVQEVKFEATGQKNLGEYATGDVVVYTYFKEKSTTPINVGAIFSISGLNYVATEAATLSWDGDGEDDTVCDNAGQTSSLVRSGCQVSARVKVKAAEPGTKYNIAASSSGWTTLAPVAVYSDKAMTGGSDEMVTVVQQSDIEKAKEQLASSNETENKDKLLATISDELMPIDGSFSQNTSSAVATPAAGEEVKDGVTPTLKATTTSTIYVIDKTKVEQFITEKANLPDDQKIYELQTPFVENFMKSDGGYIGKLKTSYAKGPKITDSEVVEMAKGKGIGDIQHDLKEIDGIVDVKTNTSYPWVTSVPNDTNKITVHIEMKEQKEQSSEE